MSYIVKQTYTEKKILTKILNFHTNFKSVIFAVFCFFAREYAFLNVIFKDICNDSKCLPIFLPYAPLTIAELEATPTMLPKEVIMACKKVKNCKSLGPNVVIKAVVAEYPKTIVNIFEKCLQNGIFPDIRNR